MKHAAGTSPFGEYEWKKDANTMGFNYVCPSLVQDCPNGNECTKAKSHCCNLESISPGIKGENFMCMDDPGMITGQWTIKKKDDDKTKIDFNFKCPANVLQNCTNDAEKECTYKSPYCCAVKGTDYKWKKGVDGNSDFKMCMDSPMRGVKKGETRILKG